MISFNGKNIKDIRFFGKAIKAVYYAGKQIWSAIQSCFGSGKWANNKPWSNKEGWKN